MHYELYIDSLFLLNFMMNLFLCLLVDRSTLRIASLWRLAAGAAVGAACALLPFLGGGRAALKLAVWTAVGTAGMLCITFRVRSLRMFLKLLERLLMCSLGMGGAMLFLIRLFPRIREGLASVPGILGMGGLFFLLFARLRDNPYADGQSLCRAVLRRKGRKLAVTALIDSGNSLFEPISGKPVCVVGRTVFEALWEGAQEGFRAVPYHSIGKSRGILPAYLLAELWVETGGMEYRFADVYVAVSDEEVSGAASAGAESVNMIINPRLFTERKREAARNGRMRGAMILKVMIPGKMQFKMIHRDKLFLRGEGDIHYIGGAEVLPPPLELEKESQVIGDLGTEYDDEAKAILIEHNLRLVVYIAKKFDNTGVGVEDLISIGTIGLIKSINTFKPDKNIKLATYASRCIENEILMYLRRNNKTKLEVSIDEPLNVDWDGNELLLSDILGTDEDVIYRDIENEVERKLLMAAISKLSEREKRIIKLRFGLGTRDGQEMTQKEVASLLGISQSYISRLEKKIMRQLKKEMSTHI